MCVCVGEMNLFSPLSSHISSVFLPWPCDRDMTICTLLLFSPLLNLSLFLSLSLSLSLSTFLPSGPHLTHPSFPILHPLFFSLSLTKLPHPFFIVCALVFHRAPISPPLFPPLILFDLILSSAPINVSFCIPHTGFGAVIIKDIKPHNDLGFRSK